MVTSARLAARLLVAEPRHLHAAVALHVGARLMDCSVGYWLDNACQGTFQCRCRFGSYHMLNLFSARCLVLDIAVTCIAADHLEGLVLVKAAGQVEHRQLPVGGAAEQRRQRLIPESHLHWKALAVRHPDGGRMAGHGS